jgi:murein DD-endopeptidase MepM/ murein hydrolase activator NlpD
MTREPRRLFALAAVIAVVSIAAPVGAVDYSIAPVFQLEAAVRPPGDEIHLVFPQDATLTWFDSTFGAGKPDGRRHMGNDLMAPKLTPVYAAADGVVTRLAVTPRAGATVMLRHQGGWETWYMHLNNDNPGTDDGRAPAELMFAEGLHVGDFVAAGDVIGYVGDSGNAEGTSPHTHFELHLNGRTVNPYPYLVAAYERALAVASVERWVEVTAFAE